MGNCLRKRRCSSSGCPSCYCLPFPRLTSNASLPVSRDSPLPSSPVYRTAPSSLVNENGGSSSRPPNAASSTEMKGQFSSSKALSQAAKITARCLEKDPSLDEVINGGNATVKSSY